MNPGNLQKPSSQVACNVGRGVYDAWVTAIPALTLLAATLVACSSRHASRADSLACPPGTESRSDSDSDVGWGEVERTHGCIAANGAWHGPAVELVSGAATGGGTSTLTGRYVDGVRVGPWTQRDAQSGATLGTFTLDAAGSGVEVIRDRLDRTRTGTLARGRREGRWIYRNASGTIAAVEIWSHGKLVGHAANLPWDPPLLDRDDACGDAGDGCQPAAP